MYNVVLQYMTNRSDLTNYEIEFVGIDVNICSFMMTVTTFFTGFLIANYGNFDKSVRIPILFLIISTFAFLYSSNIFGNASGEIMSGNKNRANKHAVVGTIISEFLGVYLLVAAIPLTITALTDDEFLRYSALIVSLFGLFAYTLSSFSIVDRYITNFWARFLYSVTLISIITICFFAQNGNPLIYNGAGTFLFVYLLLTSIIVIRRKTHYSKLIE